MDEIYTFLSLVNGQKIISRKIENINGNFNINSIFLININHFFNDFKLSEWFKIC